VLPSQACPRRLLELQSLRLKGLLLAAVDCNIFPPCSSCPSNLPAMLRPQGPHSSACRSSLASSKTHHLVCSGNPLLPAGLDPLWQTSLTSHVMLLLMWYPARVGSILCT